MTEKEFTRAEWSQLREEAIARDVRLGGYYEEGVRCVMLWAGPDNHPDNWDEEWEFFHGDKGLYPEKRAFIGWVAATDWSEDGDDGFDAFEVRTRNIQAIKVHRDSNDWQTTEVRTRLINREEDLAWAKEMFLNLFRDVFPDREDPAIRISQAEFDVPDDFPSYLQPASFRDLPTS